jgi:hypothetical protein
VVGDGVVEAHPAFLDEAQDRRRGELLGDRADLEGGLRRRRPAARHVRVAVALGEDQVRPAHDDHREAGEASALEGRLRRRIDVNRGAPGAGGCARAR